MNRKTITLQDILLLIEPNGDSEENIIISEQGEKETWVHTPTNSTLLWVNENLKREVESIGVEDGLIQIWLKDKEIKNDRHTEN